MKKYTVNEEYFDSINSEIKAYFLGFIYADGNVYISNKNYAFSICINTIDSYLLDIIKQELNYTGPLHYKKNNVITLQIGNKKLVNSLINLGVVPRKSLVLTFPNYLSKDLIPHFIRGYLDGDGYIGKESIYILGTENFCNSIKNISDTLNINSRVEKVKDKRIYRFTIYGRVQCKTFLDFIYKNSDLHLNRKYKKYLDIIEHQDNKIKKCKIENCNLKHKGHGYCTKHYYIYIKKARILSN